MKKIEILLTLIVILLFLVEGCTYNKDPLAKIEQKVQKHLRNEAPAIATLGSAFGLVFTNFTDNWVYTDDIYTRKDIGIAYYGFELENVKIKVTKGSNPDRNVLHVVVPELKIVGKNRKVIDIDFTHKDYKPKDESGNYINVENYMSGKFDDLIKKYNNKNLDMAEKFTRDYFQTLADRLNLD
jgi:hypothetical protein